MNHLQAGRAVSALRPRGPVLPAALAIIYVVAWVAGLMVSPAGADVTASTAQVITSYLAQRGVATASYLLTEGVAAVALAGVVITLWQAARRRHAGSSASLTLSAGLVAAGISMLQCVTGLFIVWWSAPSGQIRLAGTLLDLVNRIDGLKMGVLAGDGNLRARAGAAASRPSPHFRLPRAGARHRSGRIRRRLPAAHRTVAPGGLRLASAAASLGASGRMRSEFPCRP